MEKASDKHKKPKAFHGKELSPKVIEKSHCKGVYNCDNQLGRSSCYYHQPFQPEEHHSQLAEHAANLWKTGKVTDIKIKLREYVYEAHKPVLTCYSTYFQKKLLVDKADALLVLDMPIITKDAFATLLEFMYTGELKITCQNIGDVFLAAQKLGIKEAVQWCIDMYSGQRKPDVQAVYLYASAMKLGEEQTAKRTLRTMTRHFEQIIGSQEFTDLTFEEVREYLSCEELAVRSEVVVFLAALKWLNCKFLLREQYAEKVIACVRFPMMTLNEILACHCPPLLPGIVEVKAINLMLLRATCYVASRSVCSEKLFEKYDCSPRKYLIERRPLILWDPNIFDPERYAQYKRETAATKIQATYRGFKTRKDIKGKPTSVKRKYHKDLYEEDLEEEAATKIQATYRGYKTRNNLKEFDSDSSSSEYSSEEEEAAAIKIQATYRGFKTRKSLKEGREMSVHRQDSETSQILKGKLAIDKNSRPSTSKKDMQNLKPPVIIAFGGINSDYHVKGVQTDTKMQIYVPNFDKWFDFDDMPMPMVRHHSCTIYSNGFIYVIGGCDPKTTESGKMVASNRCYKYSLENKKWIAIANLKHCRLYHATAVVKELIYVVGGQDDNQTMLDSIECYDPNRDKWYFLSAKLHSPTIGVAACSYNDSLWIAGGMTQDKSFCVLSDVWSLDVSSQKWTNVTELPVSICFSSLVVCQNKLYHIGGSSYPQGDKKLSSIAKVYSYNDSYCSWEASTPLPFGRHLSTAVSIGENIYLLDGMSTEKSYITLNDVIMWNQNIQDWKTCESLPFSRIGISVATIETKE